MLRPAGGLSPRTTVERYKRASSPVFFARPRVGRIPSSSAVPEKVPRARGTPRVQTDPRASTPRDIEACRSPVPAALKATGKPQVRQSLWRPARGVSRFAPQRPRWTSVSGTPSFLADWQAAYPPLAARGVGGPGPLRLGPPGPRSASPLHGHSPATAPRPMSEMLQTPLGIETGCAQRKSAGTRRDNFSVVLFLRCGVRVTASRCFSA
jgi:hypothetical protein